MAELAKMYPPQANTPETSLSGALTAAGTTVNVVDGTMLPDAPNLLTIGADGSTAETVLMTEKSGNVLTVVRGQDGTTARAWSAGDVIGRYFTAADQKAMQDNITALNNGMKKFPGVIIFSSRDHQVVETTANRIMEIINGQLIDKITTYDEYLESDEMARKRFTYTLTESEENDD